MRKVKPTRKEEWDLQILPIWIPVCPILSNSSLVVIVDQAKVTLITKRWSGSINKMSDTQGQRGMRRSDPVRETGQMQ